MKLTGLSVLVLLVIIIFLSGCVQIIINTPQIPGTPASTPVPETTKLLAADTPATPTPAFTSNTVRSPDNSGFIVPSGDLSRKGYRTFTFNYAPNGYAKEYTIRVPVNMSVLYGARESRVPLPSSSEHPEDIKKYIATFESDPAMDELYTGVLTQLRNARYQNGDYLSDDQYLELIVSFVQQIPWIENSSSKRKYPIEVIYDKSGDSDEKSLLLANLLAQEGYDVSLLVFEDVGLEEVGIRIKNEVPDSNIKVFSDGKKDYVYIEAETKDLAFIGNTPSSLKTADNPGIYPVGNGTKSYGQINFNWKIVTDLNHLIDTKKETVQSLKANPKINSWDRIGTCMWIKNSKELQNTTCYCCDM